MSVLFNHARRYDLYDRNPIQWVRQSAKRRSPPDVLTSNEVRRLLAALEPRERIMVLLDVATGLRQSELFALKWKDVDFKNKQLRVTRSIVQQVVGRCKTEASQKPVPLHDHLIRGLGSWRRTTPYQTPESWVFASLRIGERTRIGDNSFFVITSARSRKDWASRSGLGGTPFAGHTPRCSALLVRSSRLCRN
jgi:integrase